MVGKTRPDRKTHASLSEQIQADLIVTKQRRRRTGRLGAAAADDLVDDDRDEQQAVLEPKAARHIMVSTRKHLQNDSDDDAGYDEGDDGGAAAADAAVHDESGFVTASAAADGYDSLMIGEEGEADEEDVELEYDDAETVATELQQFDDIGDAFGIDEDEAAAFDRFQPQSGVRSRNLADIIMAKIKEHEQKKAAAAAGVDLDAEDGSSQAGGSHIDSRVRKVYLAIGTVLKRYTSGKIPKAFKVLPHVQNWEELLMLTHPEDWSPHATYAATRIFASHLNERMAQRYFNAILLPIVHDAMHDEKKLHPALFMAVRKALFKPVAFFKGFLLPLCNEGECTLREALAVSAVLQKMHLPPVPTAVALVKISQMPYTPALALFLRVLIDKKMSLPYQAVDALVKYFHRFTLSHPSSEPLPVLWHQTLLCFAQHYKLDLTTEQLDLLKQVCSKHFHHMITPEVRREIAAAQGSKQAGAMR